MRFLNFIVPALALCGWLLSPGSARAEISIIVLADSVLDENELEVLVLMARGDANKQIAARLAIAERTVKSHVTHVFDNLAPADAVLIVTNPECDFQHSFSKIMSFYLTRPYSY